MQIIKYDILLNTSKKPRLKKVSSQPYRIDKLDNPKKIVDMLNNLYELSKMAEEYMYMIAVNARCRCLGIFEISHGNDSFSFCDPRQVFTRALLLNASGIILVHNHPSESEEPSEQDEKICRRIQKAGHILNIKLLDNIIVTSNGYTSFNENGMLNDTESKMT